MLIEFLKSLIDMIDLPAVVLLFMLIGIAVAMTAKQKDETFDWGDAFRDESGKVSWTRAAVPISLAISSWALVYVVMDGIHSVKTADDTVKVLHELFWWNIAYAMVWAGTKTVVLALNILKLYFENKAGKPMPTEETK